MIESLKIQNFQRHSKLRIDFDPGVTSIVGASDAGKSSIIRALRWAATNQPNGEAFIRDGSKGCTVQLTADGKTVTRRRGGTKNEYKLGEKEYKAFGATVPEEIAKTLNVADINFQSQHDAAFWLSETPGEVSRQLNAVVDLGIIDDALRAVGSVYQKANAAVDVSRDRLADAEKRAGELEWVADASVDYTIVEDAETERDEIRGQLASMRSLVENAKSYAETKRRQQTLKFAADEAVTAGELLMTVEVGRRHLAWLVRLVVECRETIDQCRRIEKAGDNLGYAADVGKQVGKERAELRALVTRAAKQKQDARAVPSTDALDATMTAFRAASTAHRRLRGAGKTAAYDRDEYKTMRDDADELADELAEALGDGCPVCGGEIK